MKKTDYSKMHEHQMSDLIEKYEALQKENKRLKDIENMFNLISTKLDTISNAFENLSKLYEKSLKEIEILKAENERLKNNNKKDSSNSSKPSSTNGSKIIPNNREKSNNTKGGQKGHKAHTLKSKEIKNLIDKDNVKYVKKVISDIEKKYPKYVLDLAVEIIITENTNCKIDKLNEVIYGDNIKSIVILLLADNYMSIDGVVKFIRAITNGQINLSKGTINNWIKDFSNKLDNDIESIDNDLLNGYYVNSDDSSIKINGKNANQLCVANNNSVHLYASTSKNRKAWSKTIMTNYYGIIVKDGTNIFDDNLSSKSQCGAHILRYLKGSYEFSDKKRKAPKMMASFLTSLNEYRNKLIDNNISSFSDEQIKRYENRYDEIIDYWGKEIKDISKIIYKDEINLYERMKGKDKKEILYFLKDFKIPFTNNNAESAQRGIKIKQKIGKFRSFDGADAYCRIKSFILTIKKRGMSLIESIIKTINNIPVLNENH